MLSLDPFRSGLVDEGTTRSTDRVALLGVRLNRHTHTASRQGSTVNPIPLVTTLTVPLQFLVGVVGALVATLAMDVVMARLPEGETPPFVAAGVLTDARPDAAPARLASVVHYVAGWLTGPLFVWFLLTTQGLLGGTSLLATVLATAVLYVLMVGFFVVVVLPRSAVASQRLGGIRRDWTLSAAVYLLVLVPLVVVGTTLV